MAIPFADFVVLTFGPAERIGMRVAQLAIVVVIVLLRIEDLVVDRAETVAAGIEQTAEIGRATFAAAACAAIAGDAAAHRRPPKAVQLRFADLARVVIVDGVGREPLRADLAVAEPASSVAAALTGRAAFAIAALAIAGRATCLAIAQGGPVGEIAVGIADLARLPGIDHTIGDGVGTDMAAKLAAIERATLTFRTTFAIAAVAVRSAAGSIGAVGPIGGIGVVRAEFAIVAIVVFAVEHAIVVDQAGAGPAGALHAATVAVVASAAVIEWRPAFDGACRIADFAFVGEIDSARFDLDPADQAMRSALGADADPRAALGGRAAFAVAADAPGNPATDHPIRGGGPVEMILCGFAYTATARGIDRSGWIVLSVDFATIGTDGALAGVAAAAVRRATGSIAADASRGTSTCGAIDGTTTWQEWIGRTGETTARGLAGSLAEQARHPGKSAADGDPKCFSPGDGEGACECVETRIVHVMPP